MARQRISVGLVEEEKRERIEIWKSVWMRNANFEGKYEWEEGLIGVCGWV